VTLTWSGKMWMGFGLGLKALASPFGTNFFDVGYL